MMIVEGLIGGVVALGGYAWFERDQRKSKLEDADRQVAEETRTEAANLLRQLTREVQSNPVSSPRGYTAGRRGNLMWSPT
jgi:hypothetical protein